MKSTALLVFCKDVETFRHEMDQANHMNSSTRAYKNGKCNKHKIPHQKTTSEILENYAEYESIRIQSISRAIETASALAKSLEIPMIMTSFIVDTGAGLNLKCYAHGLSTREISDLAMMSIKSPRSNLGISVIKTVLFLKIVLMFCLLVSLLLRVMIFFGCLILPISNMLIMSLLMPT